MLIIKGHRSQIRDLIFITDGMAVASIAGKGYAISLWEATTGERRSYLSAGYEDTVTSICAHPNGEDLYACQRWSGLRIWNLKTEKVTNVNRCRSIYSHYDQILISHDGEQCFLVPEPSWYGLVSHVYIFDLVGKKANLRTHQLASFGAEYGTGSCRSLSLSPNKKLFAASVQSRKETRARVLKLSGPPLPESSMDLGEGRAVAFSPDGKWLAVAVDSHINLHSTNNWEIATTFHGHTERVNHLAFSPDGAKLVSGGDDSTVRMWELATESEERHFDWGIGQISRVAFAPDGMRAAAGGQRQIVIWDVD